MYKIPLCRISLFTEHIENNENYEATYKCLILFKVIVFENGRGISPFSSWDTLVSQFLFYVTLLLGITFFIPYNTSYIQRISINFLWEFIENIYVHCQSEILPVQFIIMNIF